MANQILQLPFEYIVSYVGDTDPDGKIKKKFKGITYKWSREKAEMEMEMMKENVQVLGIMRNIPLKKTKYIVIDIDSHISYKDLIELFPILDTTLHVKGNTKGFHFYFETDWVGKKNFIDCFDEIDADIITEQIFELDEKKWNDTPIQFITAHQLQEMVSTDTQIIQDETDDETTSTPEIKIGEFEREIIDNIDPKSYTSYMDWLKFIWAIRFSNFENPLDIANEYSKKIDGYVSREDVENKMMDARHEKIGWPYLMNLSKKSNPQNYTEINKKNKQNEKIKMAMEKEENNAEIFRQMVEEFEKTHCKIIDNGFYVRDENNEVVILDEKTVIKCYKHMTAGISMSGIPISFINKWLTCNDHIHNKKKVGIHPANCPENTSHND